MVKLTIVGSEGLNPREKDVFKHAEYFECEKFNYTYSSAVNKFNFAHTGSSRNNQFSGKVISPDDWEQLTTDLRIVVGDENMRNVKVEVYNWAFDLHGVGYLETGYTFKNSGRIIAYAIWDKTNLSGEYTTRITDDVDIIG